MKKIACLVLLLISVLAGCVPSVGTLTSFDVAGTYQLIWYSNTTLSDDNPSGMLQIVETDGSHIDLSVQGQSGKTKIKYAYTNVLVSINGTNTAGQMNYNLYYKNHLIGTAHVDGVSRYVILNPSAKLRIEGVDL